MPYHGGTEADNSLRTIIDSATMFLLFSHPPSVQVMLMVGLEFTTGPTGEALEPGTSHKKRIRERDPPHAYDPRALSRHSGQRIGYLLSMGERSIVQYSMN